MDEEAAVYHAYLLRIWHADNDGRPVWRFVLQPAGGGAPEIFSDPHALVVFLSAICRMKGGSQ